MHSKHLAAATLFVVIAAFHAAFAEEPVKEPTPKPAGPSLTIPILKDLPSYDVPEKGDAKALVTFCKTLLEFRPKTEAEGEAHSVKVPVALRAACTKILELEKSEKTEDGRFARRIQLGLKAQELDPQGPSFSLFVDEFKAFLAAGKIEGIDVAMAMELPGVYEQMEKPEKAKELYEFFSKIFEKNPDPEIASAGKRLMGNSRRLDLVGKEMELKGTTVGGKPFEIASLKGQVVLVDFWATWCPYCIKEIPSIQKLYAGYHAKGFEVVGISADEDREKLDAYLAQQKLPWINLHDKGGNNPAMEYYGIPGFPTTFLIGKDGKVVSLEARGPKLAELLKAQLGEPDAVKEPAPATPDAPKTAPEKPAAAPSEAAKPKEALKE